MPFGALGEHWPIPFPYRHWVPVSDHRSPEIGVEMGELWTNSDWQPLGLSAVAKVGQMPRGFLTR